MNQKELIKKVEAAANTALYKKHYIAPVDVLMAMNLLSKKDYEDWRRGKVDYLERRIQINIGKIATILKVTGAYAKGRQLKPSYTAYMSWGKGPSSKLRFSKSGADYLEKIYATHYIVPKDKTDSPRRVTESPSS